jgi:L-malate glycosyltransferase
MTQARVLIIQEMLPEYRVAFFERLRGELSAHDVQLDLIHGVPPPHMALRGGYSEVKWASTVPVIRLGTSTRSLTVQATAPGLLDADLIIIEQASRHVLNSALLLAPRAVRAKVAVWGHGRNLQARAGLITRVSEAWKRVLTRRADWCFAYTPGSADRFAALGFERSRITTVFNSVDTAWADKQRLARIDGRCVFLGSLHRWKRLDILVRASDLVAARVPTFSLTVIGDGPLRGYMRQAAAHRPFMELKGPQHSGAKARDMLRGQLLAVPGLVGLAVVDAFAAGLPVVTTDVPYQSPEFEYIEPPGTGLVVSADPYSYADALVRLLTAPRELQAMQMNAREASERYSIGNMVSCFTQGILCALDASDGRCAGV